MPSSHDLRALLGEAYPALIPGLDAHPEDLTGIVRGARQPRDLRTYRRLASAAAGDLSDASAVRRGLRRFAAREKLRIAARELLAHPGQDVDVTARELGDLADACCEVALSEALAWAEARFGAPLAAGGEACPFVVIGMGKLGGRELNAGSDVDLMLFYETDEGGAAEHSLHEHFTRVAQRFVATLDEPTDDGFVWRVDLRLRPEGTRGPLVNALAAAERYYETWGRTWERAALVRARPVAGDLRFGARLMEALGPFVWRKTVDPRIVGEMKAMLARARVEAGGQADDDLKIGPGGIREVEFFAQSLQLVWGGREPRVRGTNTLDALRRLRARGFVSEREEEELSDAYLFLRRLEHRIQFATGLQTHSLPSATAMVERIARSLGYDGPAALRREVDAVRARVSSRFASLGREPATDDLWFERLAAALDARDEAAVAAASTERFGVAASGDLPRHLLALARRPDGPLGATTRDRDAPFTRLLVDALAGSADPEQATRLLAAFFARLATPGLYVRALADDPRVVRALASLLGASVFLGEAMVGHPDLADRIVYARGVPTPDVARAQVDEEVAALGDDAGDVDAFVGALRRAKRRVTFEVGLADLAGELATREAAHVLTALADATVEHACRFAMNERGHVSSGLAVVAMGKLGGRELGYGSDLDVLFVYEDGDDDAAELFARIAQRVLRLLGTPHGEGPGYELDTRLRPSGSHGLLVVSLEAFARYQAEQAEGWERQALVKARACAGDAALGARVLAVAHAAAYERGAPDPERMHHLRTRMERELTHERLDRPPARYDVKLGRGGIVDVEFAAQWLQMQHGMDPRVRTTETEVALAALETCGYLEAALADVLREGWRFLRRLEQRLRVSHGTSATLLDEGAPGLAALARRMGMRDAPRARADAALLERYVAVSRDVRAAYLRVLGVKDGAESAGASQ
ncbi:MAG TPA: bifunctional [glutamate--ammonia ligase]-adenylyl-L-tyrosine phosphorylase/[glutamate--ammonia-ligase] adenylyltransferase [Polyangiaceae bacterium]